MLITYPSYKLLYKSVALCKIAEQHRRKTGEEPVIAVDGHKCVWYLYGKRDFWCGGQYREFREACRNFVREFRDCGVRLVFFFHGLRPAEKDEEWVQVCRDNVEKMNQLWKKLHVGGGRPENPNRLPEGLIPCARVILRDEPPTEVRLCLEDYNREMAEYAATCKNCLGVMSNNGNFLVYKGVPRLFIFDNRLHTRTAARMLWVSSAVIASDLGLKVRRMPALATFLGNGFIDPEELKAAHRRLGCSEGDVEETVRAVADLVRDRTVKEMCRAAFGRRWREFLQLVTAGIDQYKYKPRTAGNGAEGGPDWTSVLQGIEARHASGEIPAALLSVARRRMFRLGAVPEDLSTPEFTSTGEALRTMRRRMYTVLLWESGDGPFRVEEQVASVAGTFQVEVEAQKWLPPTVVHPGLLQLWTGDLETRWRLFSWIVGAPDPDGSALRSLEPRCLVGPAAALSFLRHEACLISPREAEVFAAVAVTVGRFSPQELAQKSPPALDPRAVFLSTLFVRAVLHVLDVAAVCGLSFPRESDCQLDAYFDGKLFHELYLKAKAQSFPCVGPTDPWDLDYLDAIQKLVDVVEGAHDGRQ